MTYKVEVCVSWPDSLDEWATEQATATAKEAWHLLAQSKRRLSLPRRIVRVAEDSSREIVS